MHCHLFSIKHPQIKIEKNQSPTEEHEKSFSPLWNWNSRVKNPRKIQGSKLDTITCRRKAGTQRSPFHPIDNPDGTRRVQASLAGRSHFNRGAEVLTWKVQVCAVQVCVRGWPTCRGRAAHYSNPCVAVCARCPPPPAYIISPRQVQCTHLQRGLVPLSPGLGQISTWKCVGARVSNCETKTRALPLSSFSYRFVRDHNSILWFF